MRYWLVIVNEQDGTGGSNPKRYRFADYDDAHEFYKHIQSLVGTSFYPTAEPPKQARMKTTIIPKGGWPRGFNRRESGNDARKKS